MPGSHRTLEQVLFPMHGNPISQVILMLARSSIEIREVLMTASISGNLGQQGSRNVSGDEQKKLDLICNDLIVERISDHHLIRRIISEELSEAKVSGPKSEHPLLLAIDPLDGSSNVDVNGTLATIFGVYQDRENGLPGGRDIVAAGYFLYGPSTMLVLSTGEGVHGFTLEPQLNQFVLSHPEIRCPERGIFLCANVGHRAQWPAGVQNYVDTIFTRSHLGQKHTSLRYSGAMANDVHRILLDGGIYIYPPDSENWAGKIRLLYESLPMAYLFSQASGASSNGYQSLLDVIPTSPHQQDQAVLGSRQNVMDYIGYLRSQEALGA